MNYPAYSTILKGLGLINACRSTTGQYLIPPPFKCRPFVTKSIGPLPALISLHLTSLTSHFAALGFPDSMKENKSSGPATSALKQAKRSQGKFLTKSHIMQTLRATSVPQGSACPKLVRVVISNRALESSCCCT